MYDITSIYQAKSADDAISALAADPEAVVIAGGSDVLIKIREGRLAGCRLVSIHELREELSGIRLTENGDVEIGALTTFRACTNSGIIQKTVPVLGEAADMVGGPQIRAVGTLGGNLCNGVTSADTASTLLAFGALLRLKGPKGERELPISQWYRGAGRVALEHGELLTAIVIPRKHYQGWSGHYIKYAQRSAMDIATLGTSCLVRLSEDRKTVEDLRLAFGVAGPVPMRAVETEKAMAGLPVERAVEEIGSHALKEVRPRDSWRASKAFRLQLAAELPGRALREAARKGGAAI